MKIVKILSSVLATIMLLGTILSAGIMTVLADEANGQEDGSAAPAGGEVLEFNATDFNTNGVVDYTAKLYETNKEKLADMELYASNYGYELYFNKTINMLGDTGNYQETSTGEWALVNTATGEILFSNPYDVASENVTSELKAKLLSQIILTYNSTGDTKTEKEMYSYTDAYERNQVDISVTRYGVRAEYIIGRVDTKKLVPRRISQVRFEDKILNPIKADTSSEGAYVYRKIKAFYELQSLDLLETEAQQEALKTAIPYVTTAPVYTITSAVTDTEMYRIEKWIKAYTEYTYEDLTADHNETGYSGTENASPNFRMALDYYLDEDGLTVKLASSGVRYDSSNLSLNTIQILPYMGCGSSNDEGYNFIPDGSGALVRFGEGYNSNVTTISSKLYGNDFSFHSVTGENQEPWRMPVYGTVSVATDKVTGETSTSAYVAVITEGETSAEIVSNPDGSKHKYRSVSPKFTPRASDTYMLESMTVSGGSTATWTVSSDKKYTGNYAIKVMMLSGDDANYAGMAKAYRKYLEKSGQIERLEKEDNIPLYIESFGDSDAAETVLGVPVTVTKPLTTFEDAQKMMSYLKDAGINNINLKYTGWVNGGLSGATAPSKLGIDSILGGDDGFEELVSYMKDEGFGLYPDFDYVVVSNMSNFDNFSYKESGTRTIDDRVATLQKYDPVYQAWYDGFGVILSPNSLRDLYNDMYEDYSEFDVGGISVSTLGGYLSSDNNSDYTLNRDDAKGRVEEFLGILKKDNSTLMTSFANAYAVPYADHILDVPLESSNRASANESVPFLGMVLHGYVNFSGTALNTAGDYRAYVLRTLENGAAPYFSLSYENTTILKATEYSKYYSILFEMWKDDVVDTYNELNEVLSGVSDSLIINHEILQRNLIRVTYDNGTVFVINYSENEVALDSFGHAGMTVGAEDFIVITK